MLLVDFLRPLPRLLFGMVLVALAPLQQSSGQASGSTQTVSAHVTWPASLQPGVAGYRIYYGTQSGTYTEIIDVGNTTTAELPDLIVGTTYYCAISLYTTAGVASAFSSEISFIAIPPAPKVADGSLVFLEAEAGTVVEPMAVGFDFEHSQVTSWWVKPTDTSGTGSVKMHFEAPVPAGYTAWCRIRLEDAQGDLFSLSLDGDSELPYHVFGGFRPSGPYPPAWIWSPIKDSSGAPRVFDLATGSHSLTFRTSEMHAKLDCVILSSDENFVPSESLLGGGDLVTITTQPRDLTVVEGETATLSITAAANGPITYQWHKNGSPIEGATEAVLHLFGVTPSDNGHYTVVAATGETSVTSNAASIDVTLPPPPIRNLAIVPSGSGSFSVSLELGGALQDTFEVYASGDLVNWALLGSRVNTTGTISLEDPEARAARRRFYRISRP